MTRRRAVVLAALLTRRTVAVALMLFWAASLAALAARRVNQPSTVRLGHAAGMLAPATYYYAVTQGERQVGSAVSSVDTSANNLVLSEGFDGDFPVAGGTLRMQTRSRTYLTRKLALDSFSVRLRGDVAPVLLRGAPRTRSGVLTPSVVPVALMLLGQPSVGRAESFWMYNPLSRAVERVRVRITADSLFSVVDSARLDSSSHRWVAARSDTVRGWSVTGSSSALTLWVDARGMVIAAREPGGITLTRTAYEIAFSNRQLEARAAAASARASRVGFPTRSR